MPTDQVMIDLPCRALLSLPKQSIYVSFCSEGNSLLFSLLVKIEAEAGSASGRRAQDLVVGLQLRRSQIDGPFLHHPALIFRERRLDLGARRGSVLHGLTDT